MSPLFCPFPFIILWKPLAWLLTQYKYLLFLKKKLYKWNFIFFQLFNYGIFFFPCFYCLLWEVSYDSYCCSPGYVLGDWAAAFNISSFFNVYLFLTVLSLCCPAWTFSSYGEQRLLSSRSVRAYRSGFSLCRAWALGCTGIPSCGAKA